MPDKGRIGTKKLVLGFDAGCFACSDLAERIQERAGKEKLTIRSLRDPEVMGWRERALGPAAPWTPTLFEVERDRVRAWTGWKMGTVLGWTLGPVATWQIMQVLGELGEEQEVEGPAILTPPRRGSSVVGMSRGQFLKAAGGAALAMSVLSGASKLASPAAAATRPPSPFDIVKIVDLSGTAASRVISRAKVNGDARFVAGGALPNITARPATSRYTLRNGTLLDLVMFEMAYGKQFLGVGMASKSIAGRAPSFAKLWNGRGGRLWDKRHPFYGTKMLYKASQGRLPVASVSRTSLSESDPLFVPSRTASGVCPPVVSAPSQCFTETERTCVAYGITSQCAVNAGVTAASCAGGVAAFLAGPGTGGLGWVVGGALAVSCVGSIALAPTNCCTRYDVTTVPRPC